MKYNYLPHTTTGKPLISKALLSIGLLLTTFFKKAIYPLVQCNTHLPAYQTGPADRRLQHPLRWWQFCWRGRISQPLVLLFLSSSLLGCMVVIPGEDSSTDTATSASHAKDVRQLHDTPIEKEETFYQQVNKGDPSESTHKVIYLKGSSVMGFSPDGKIGIHSYHTGEATVFDVKTGKLLRTLELPRLKSGIFGIEILEDEISFSGDGTKVAIYTRMDNVFVWDLTSGKVNNIFNRGKHEGLSSECDVQSVALSSSGKLLIIGCHNGLSIVHDVNNGKILQVIDLHASDVPWKVAISPNEKTVAIRLKEEVVLFDLHKAAMIHRLRAGGDNVLAFSPDGDKLIVGFKRGNVAVYDVKSGNLIHEFIHKIVYPGLDDSYAAISNIAISEDGNTLLVGSSDDWRPGGRHSLGGWHSGIWLWDLKSFKKLGFYKGHCSSGVKALAFLPGKNAFISVGGIEPEAAKEYRYNKWVGWEPPLEYGIKIYNISSKLASVEYYPQELFERGIKAMETEAEAERRKAQRESASPSHSYEWPLEPYTLEFLCVNPGIILHGDVKSGGTIIIQAKGRDDARDQARELYFGEMSTNRICKKNVGNGWSIDDVIVK